ncbi:MAG: choice-of-anchor F family protein [Limnospira sp.]
MNVFFNSVKKVFPIQTGFVLGAIWLGLPESAIAGTLTGWNSSNAFIDNLNTTTLLFPDSSGGGSSSGQIVWDLDEGASPGIDIDNTLFNFSGNTSAGCILAAGDVTCDSDRQSGKRFKMQATSFEPIDLLFDVEADGEENLFRVFQKIGNLSHSSLRDFTIRLGFGVGDEFTASSGGDGLGFFVPDDPRNSELAALFAAGLFSPAGQPPGSGIGYFDDDRSGFHLNATEDAIVSNGLFGDYLERFDAWLNLDSVATGYFLDDDGDPATDAVLVANWAEGQWFRQGDVAIADPSLEFADAPLCSDVAPGTPCYFEGPIEDLANLNLNYSLLIGDISTWQTYDSFSETGTFTLRLQAKAVPEPGSLGAILAAAGLGLSCHRRRNRRS